LFVLILSLICMPASDINSARDSAITYIKAGDFAAALDKAKAVIVQEKHDYLLLGLFKYASTFRLIDKLAPGFDLRLYREREDICRAWKLFLQNNKENHYILQVMPTLYIHTETKTARLYLDRLITVDSANSTAHFMKGFSYERDNSYTDAIRCYRFAYALDTNFTDCLTVIAHIHMKLGQFDSALAIFKKISQRDGLSRSTPVSKSLCELKLGRIASAKNTLSMLESVQGDAWLRKCYNQIEYFIKCLETNGLKEQDTTVVAIPLIVHRLNLHMPVDMAAVLSEGGISIIDLRDEMPRWFLKYISRETGNIPDYILEKPRVIDIPAPEYPLNARTTGIEGEVIVETLVDRDGTVAYVAILKTSGYDALDNAALEAASKARFEPATHSGRPVPTWISIPFSFSLHN